MNYRVLVILNLKTSKGEIALHPEQVVALNNDVAIKLLNQGKITPIGNVSYRIYSKILGDYLWIMATEKGLQELVDEGITEVIYTQKETNKLMTNKVSKEGLVAIHKIKKTFSGATVEDIENEHKKI